MGHVAEREIVPGLVLHFDPAALARSPLVAVWLGTGAPTEGPHLFVCLSSGSWAPLLTRSGSTRMYVNQCEKSGHERFVRAETHVSLYQVWAIPNSVVIAQAKLTDRSLPRSRLRIAEVAIAEVIRRNAAHPSYELIVPSKQKLSGGESA